MAEYPQAPPVSMGFPAAWVKHEAGTPISTPDVPAAPRPIIADPLEEAQVTAAQRGGAIYEEIYQILGPGVTPRQLAGATCMRTPPPTGCTAAKAIRRAVCSGSPVPKPPVEGWACQDLRYIVAGLATDWGIQVVITDPGGTVIHGAATAPPQHVWFDYTWTAKQASWL